MRRWSTTAVTAWSALPPLRLALRRDAASPRARRRRACSWHRCRARPPRTRSRRSFRSTVKCSRSSCSRTVLRGPMPSCSTRCVPPRVSLVARVFCLCLPSLCVCCFSVLLYLGGVLVRGVLYCIGDQRWCWWRGVGVGVVFCCGFFCAFSRRLREVRWRWRGGGEVWRWWVGVVDDEGAAALRSNACLVYLCWCLCCLCGEHPSSRSYVPVSPL